MMNVDFAFRADEAHREPFLRLAAIFAFPDLAHDVARNIVVQPIRNLADALHRADVGLLAQFPQRRRPRLFTVIDAALRHLPSMGEVDMLGPFNAAADKNLAVAIEQHDADTGTIGEIFEVHGSGEW